MIPIDQLTGRLGNRLFQYAYMYSQMRDGVIPDVYVQDNRYFDKYSDEIRQLYGRDIGFLDFVGVHIRRGDYVGNPFHVSMSDTDYYKRAMDMFPSRKFLVFSDDTAWCKEYFKDNVDVQVMEGGTELEDFNMLASCSDVIMANSSFSWWAAYLCPNPAKTVVLPKLDTWFHDNVIRVGVPDSWKQI